MAQDKRVSCLTLGQHLEATHHIWSDTGYLGSDHHPPLWMPITNNMREMSTTSMHMDTYTQLSNLELIQLGTMRPEDFWKLQWQASLDTAALKMTLGYRYRVIGIQCCLSCSALAKRAPWLGDFTQDFQGTLTLLERQLKARQNALRHLRQHYFLSQLSLNYTYSVLHLEYIQDLIFS